MRRVSGVPDAAILCACLSIMFCTQIAAQEAAPSTGPAAAPADAEQAAVQPRTKADVKPHPKHQKPGTPNLRSETRKGAPPKSAEAPMASPVDSATAAKTPAPAAQSQPATAQAPVPAAAPTGEFEPVVHARNAKVGVCMDNIVGQSGRVIDRPHQAASTWVTSAPDENVFSSIVSLSYPNKLTPNGAAVILAAPIGAKKCQGQSVQIYPTARSCTAVQASLIQIGKTIGTLENLPLLQLKDGSRNLLMPTAGGGCVVVTVQLRQ